MAESADPATELLSLACLTYADDGPDRWREAVEILYRHPDLPSADVHVAAATGDARALADLLGADPQRADARRPDGWTPLMCLTYARVPQDDPYGAARLLLEAGADPDAGVLLGGDAPPFTVLTGCFGEGEQGPGRQPRHPQGEALAGLLLDHGPTRTTARPSTTGCSAATTATSALLLAHGLGRGDGGPWRRRLGDRQDSPQRMVALQVDWARDHGLVDRLALLAAYGFVDPVPPGEASPWRERGTVPPIVGAGTPAGVRAVAAAGGDVDAKSHGRTLLHHAAWMGDVDLVRALLDAGADPQVLDDDHARDAARLGRVGLRQATAALLRPVTPGG